MCHLRFKNRREIFCFYTGGERGEDVPDRRYISLTGDLCGPTIMLIIGAIRHPHRELIVTHKYEIAPLRERERERGEGIMHAISAVCCSREKMYRFEETKMCTDTHGRFLFAYHNLIPLTAICRSVWFCKWWINLVRRNLAFPRD